MSEVLILIGVIMIAAGVVMLYLGIKRNVPNTPLWSLFPILHGLHEFADYALESGMPFIVERFEIFFAVAGSFVLLAAALEYNGVIPRPIGKFVALIGLISVSYFIFALPEQIIEDMEHSLFDFGFITSNPIRFFQGFFMTIVAILAILLTTIYITYQSKKEFQTIDRKLIEIMITSIVLLSIYAFFEGFLSEDPIFITLRAISLSLFIIVPIYFILVNYVGLQRLLIIQQGGIPVLGYNFPSHTFLSFDTPEGADFILAAGFLSAVSSFSGDVLKSGTTISIRSNRLYFLITQINGTIYALQALHANKNLETVFFEFGSNLNPGIQNIESPDDLNKSDIKSKIDQSFSLFY